MHYANLSLAEPTRTIRVPSETIRTHQIQVVAGQGVSGTLSVYGRTPAASGWGKLGDITLGATPDIKIMEGVYAELRFVPPAETGYSYGVHYVGW